MESSCTLCLQIISLTVWTGLSIAMIAIGAIYKDDCPVQPYIPIFLLAFGVTHLVVVLILLLRGVLEICSLILEGLIGFFTFAWFITGSIWVFSLYSKDKGPDLCNETLYYFAFGVLIFEYVLIGLSLIFPCIGCSLKICFYERLE
ncbi:transmembrane protein 272-like isoform 1-T2 [Anomaloglossus baeobatrachus]|uniref:transmembrane protein 272-like n=1 Tax=Anomaloglossus baeobatrachus TaxID=238106 RepID=UPI003F4FC514